MQEPGQDNRFLRRMRRGSASPSIVTVIYLAVGLGWILLSDQVVGSWSASYPIVQTIKGSAYVVVTAAVLFVLLLRRERELARAVNALYESETLHRAVVEAAGEGIALVSRDGVATFMNPRMREILALGDQASTDLIELVDERDRQAASRELSRVMEGAITSLNIRFRADQRSIDVELCMAPLKGATGSIDGAVVMLTDISGRIAAEGDRDRARGLVEESARAAALGRLASSVAHEFNNVLMGILPFVEVIRRVAGTDPKLEKAIASITTSVDRGRSITQDILGFARLASPEIRNVNVREWLQELSVELRRIMSDTVPVDLTIDDPDVTMSADAQQLRQVMLTLAQDARGRMPEGGTLSIEAGRGDRSEGGGTLPEPERFAHIRITDSGPGIPPEVLPQVFEPLFALKGRTGKGLALPIAHQIATNHRGHLFVSNPPGGGTAFDLYVPLAAE